MELDRELKDLFARGVDRPLDDEAFDALALRVFRHQAGANPVYGRYARARGVSPDDAARWSDVPPVPTRAFKRLALACGDPDDADAVFVTSGTTGGEGRRGRHHVLDLDLYHASLLPNLEAHLLPDGLRPPIFALLPPPAEAPASSLVHMVDVAMERFGASGSGYFVEAGGDGGDDAGSGAGAGLAAAELRRAVDGAVDADEAVLVAGTAFSFVHWLDALEDAGVRLRLPPGSRLMETGGFKGRSRSVPREELYGAVEERLGIPGSHVVNEYGMTEMLSQFWEPVLREALAGEPVRRRHVPPPWVRTRVLDPSTLAPLPPGEVGLLHHFDLANLHSVSSILTEDLGVAVEGGFHVLGRAGDAEPRGCSIAMDDLLSASGTSR